MYKRIALIMAGLILIGNINVSANIWEEVKPLNIAEDKRSLSENETAEISVSVNVPNNLEEEEKAGVSDETEKHGLPDVSENVSVVEREEEQEVIESVLQEEESFNDTEIVSADTEINNELEENETKTIISANDVIETDETQETDEGESLISENSAEQGQESEEKNNTILKVEMPTSTRVHIDPENWSGKGQISSDSYQVINYGNTDVIIRIKNIKIIHRNEKEQVEFSEIPVLDDGSKEKKMNLNMVWGNRREENGRVLNVMDGKADADVICLEAAKYDGKGQFIELNKNSEGVFYFTGTVNPNPDIQWIDDEVSIDFDYQIVTVKDVKREKNMNESVETEEVLSGNEILSENETICENE